MDPEPKFLCNSGTVNLQKITNFQKKMKIIDCSRSKASMKKLNHYQMFDVATRELHVPHGGYRIWIKNSIYRIQIVT